jgi:RecG-like helicase
VVGAIRQFLRRFLSRLAESDEQRLAEEVRTWCEGIPGTVRIADAKPRSKVKLAGMVRRITVRPIEGFEALEIVLSDGTGLVTARWLGRRKIPGLALGSRLVIEGVLGEGQGARRIVNPTYEFA